MIRLDRRLFSATVYPADYGFVPDTLAEDGDPLDVLVLLEDPTFPGCWVRVRADRRVLDGGREGARRQDPLRARPRSRVRRHSRSLAAPARAARRDRALLRRLQDARAGQGERDRAGYEGRDAALREMGADARAWVATRAGIPAVAVAPDADGSEGRSRWSRRRRSHRDRAPGRRRTAARSSRASARRGCGDPSTRATASATTRPGRPSRPASGPAGTDGASTATTGAARTTGSSSRAKRSGRSRSGTSSARTADGFTVLDVPKAPIGTDPSNLVIADWMSHGAHLPPVLCHPDSVWRSQLSGWLDRDNTNWDCHTARSPSEFVDDLCDRAALRTRFALDVMSSAEWDALVLVFAETHSAGHGLWGELDRVEAVYRAVDAELGRIIDAAGPSSTVMVFSPLGMGPHYPTDELADAVLERLTPDPPTSSPRYRRVVESVRARVPRSVRRACTRARPARVVRRTGARFRPPSLLESSDRSAAHPDPDQCGRAGALRNGRARCRLRSDVRGAADAGIPRPPGSSERSSARYGT